MILSKKPHFLKLKTELMGGSPNGDDRTCMASFRFIFLSLTSTGYSNLLSLYCPLSFYIGLFQTAIKRIFKGCKNHSLMSLNCLGGRNLSGQVHNLLQRRSARKEFCFGRWCLTNGNNRCFCF